LLFILTIQNILGIKIEHQLHICQQVDFQHVKILSLFLSAMFLICYLTVFDIGITFLYCISSLHLCLNTCFILTMLNLCKLKYLTAGLQVNIVIDLLRNQEYLTGFLSLYGGTNKLLQL
jgi:hypothetical protein